MAAELNESTPRASVIMTTFRSPDYLRQVLQGFASQTTPDFEVIVGEDGQTEATRVVVDEFRRTKGLEVRYVSQVHQGFGKTRILNRAITASRGRYLIFTDGDCVPREDFVQTHLGLSRPGRFLSGGCIRLNRPVTNRILAGEVATSETTDVVWLSNNGMTLSGKWKLIRQRPLLALACDTWTTTKPTFNGHNASAWKEDVVRANGFNHDMKYGGLDRELGERLENSGIAGLQIRHRAICFHLDHDRGYVTDEDWQRNRDIRNAVRRLGTTRAANGMDQLESIAKAA